MQRGEVHDLAAERTLDILPNHPAAVLRKLHENRLLLGVAGETQVVEHPGVTREGQDHKVRDGEAAKQNG